MPTAWRLNFSSSPPHGGAPYHCGASNGRHRPNWMQSFSPAGGGRAMTSRDKPMQTVSEENLRQLIFRLRGQEVMLDSDLAVLYGVQTKVFNQAVKRNQARFPDHFRFQLERSELDELRSRFVTSRTWGGVRHLPYAFTEQGVAMLSAVVRSDTAIQTSIQIIDAFVTMRRYISGHGGLLHRGKSISKALGVLSSSSRLRPTPS